jgi:hypothetical protein
MAVHSGKRSHPAPQCCECNVAVLLGNAGAAQAMWLRDGNRKLGPSALVVTVTLESKPLPDLREGYYVEAQT